MPSPRPWTSCLACLLLTAVATPAVDVVSVGMDGSITEMLADPFERPRLSGNGRYVVFSTCDPTCVAGDTNGASDVFRLDRQTGSVIRVSLSNNGSQLDGGCYDPDISDDGNRVVFRHRRYDQTQINGAGEIFLRDIAAGTTTALDPATPAGYGILPTISADGAVAAYTWIDTHGNGSIRVVTLATHAIVRGDVSSSGTPGGCYAYSGPRLSGDGRFVVFPSNSTTLVSGDGNGQMDVFRHDCQTGTTIRVSLANDGSEANGPTGLCDISSDGRYVAFSSSATNLVAGNTHSGFAPYLRDIQAGTTSDANPAGPDSANTSSLSISGDGRRIAFDNYFLNALPEYQSYVSDLDAATTTVISRTSGGQTAFGRCPALSRDGAYAISVGDWTGLESGSCGPAIHLRQLATGSVSRISIPKTGREANGQSATSGISGNGRYVLFYSQASNLTSDDQDAFTNLFVQDMVTGVCERVDVTTDGSPNNSDTDLIEAWSMGCPRSAISDDGRYVLFRSLSTHLDAGGHQGVFLRDRILHTTVCLESDPYAYVDDMTPDGRYACISRGDYWYTATGIHRLDLMSHAQTQVTVDRHGATAVGNFRNISMTSDGRYVMFDSDDSELVPGDTNGVIDIFVRDLQAGSTTRVSLDPVGGQLTSDSYAGGISDDGRWVLFTTHTTGQQGVYLLDRTDGSRKLLASNAWAYPHALSADGRYAVFSADPFYTVYVYDRLTRMSRCTSPVINNNFYHCISRDGSQIAFDGMGEAIPDTTSWLWSVFRVAPADTVVTPGSGSLTGGGSGAGSGGGGGGGGGSGCGAGAGAAVGLLLMAMLALGLRRR